MFGLIPSECIESIADLSFTVNSIYIIICMTVFIVRLMLNVLSVVLAADGLCDLGIMVFR
ncbi:hypothetical protein [Pectinatus haikarae]|uniref:hypothetical protein n=1 Tax=Pectinatus haikarae TaxID=349096 RepID=UPI0027D82F5C|nr:hypothetical protein [Pectinatus haikarae]